MEWHMKNANEMWSDEAAQWLCIKCIHIFSCIFSNNLLYLFIALVILCSLFLAEQQTNKNNKKRHRKEEEEEEERKKQMKHVWNVINKKWNANIWNHQICLSDFDLRWVFLLSLHLEFFFMITFVERCHFSLIISYLHVVFLCVSFKSNKFY